MRPTTPILRLLPLAALLVVGNGFAAFADVQTRIVSINGTVAMSHAAQLTVQPGDTVNLTADEVSYSGYGEPTAFNRDVEDFRFSSDFGANDSCDPNYDCSDTNFEVNEYGVTFDVPASIQQSLTITVVNARDGSSDQLTLVNGSYVADYRVPSDAYTDPSAYDSDTFDYNRALVGQGRWVMIDGENTFVPYSYADDWQPYQNGSWIYSSYGVTWNSYDPWGWVTDHYGFWRHHNVYGWVWRAFPEVRWRPHAVTFFYGEDGMGWYPYTSARADRYARGAEYGWDDGFWLGNRVGLERSWRWGGWYVRSRDFCGTNVRDVRYGDVVSVYGTAYNSHAFGRRLLGAGFKDERGFVEARIGRSVEVTEMRVESRRMANGRAVQFVRPARVIEPPAQYRQVGEAARERVRYGVPGARIPVGSVVRPGGAIERPRAPVVVAPRIPNGNGEFRPMPSRTRVPVDRPRPVNPNPRPEPRPMPQPQPRPEPRPMPQPQPRPEPRPMPQPQPRPEPRPMPQPQPRPEPRPMPQPQPRPEPRPMPQPQPRPEPRPMPQPQPRPEPRPMPQPQPRPEPRPMPQPQPRPEPRPMPQPQPRPEPRPMPQPQPRPEPRPQPQPQPQPRPQPQPGGNGGGHGGGGNNGGGHGGGGNNGGGHGGGGRPR